MRIGFIGTGSMGNPVAANLLGAGHHLFVHDVRPQACANLLEGGAKECATPAEVAAQAEVIILSLPSHVEVEQVCFGPQGILTTAARGTALIDLTTISVSLVPALVATQESHGLRYLACPVSQGVDNARLGRLSVFAGGDSATLESCRPLLDTIATKVIHTGDQASAIAAKLLTNLLWFVNAAAIGEALALGAKVGIELGTLQEVVLNSCGTSWVAEHDLGSIYNGSFDETFTTALCVKDLGLISELAEQSEVPLEVGGLARQIFGRAQDTYGPQSPELSVVRYVQELTGVSLQSE